MVEFYGEIRLVHIVAVLASGMLFLLRGLLMIAGQQWARAAPLRYLSYSIDTILLTAALMLMTIVHQYPFVHSWLTVKILLLVVYIVLGYLALNVKTAPRPRVLYWVAALAVYAFIISIARAHNPFGIFA